MEAGSPEFVREGCGGSRQGQQLLLVFVLGGWQLITSVHVICLTVASSGGNALLAFLHMQRCNSTAVL